MSDIRGKDPAGKPKDILTDAAGHLLTRGFLYGLAPNGEAVVVRVSQHGTLEVGGKVHATPWVAIPGIGAAAAFADEDAFGTVFQFDVPTSGIIQSALVVDEDDEALAVDLVLFRDEITSGTDNSAYAPTRTDLLNFEGYVRLGTRGGVSGATLGNNDGIAKAYVAPKGRLWVQAVARGALNIAADKAYYVSLRILADE